MYKQSCIILELFSATSLQWSHLITTTTPNAIKYSAFSAVSECKLASLTFTKLLFE